MTRLAERIGIAMSPVLLEPTFNGRPIRANSADESRSYGILRDARAARGSLDDGTARGSPSWRATCTSGP